MHTIIIGCGLLGGSLGKALHQKKPKYRLTGIEPDTTSRQAASSSGIFDAVYDSIATAPMDQADIIVLAIPVAALEPVIATMAAQQLKANVVLTDVIGVKGHVEQLLANKLNQHHFVGSHPMAGGVQQGFSQSRADLFAERAVAVCPMANKKNAASYAQAVQTIEQLWQDTGAKIYQMSAKEHDQQVALLSHLPYLTSLTLMQQWHQAQQPPLWGPGWLTSTHHSQFDAHIMADLMTHNPALSKTLRQQSQLLQEMANAIDKKDNDTISAVAADAAQSRKMMKD